MSMWSFVVLSFTWHMFSSFINVVACMKTSFFLVLNNIPLYGWTTFYLSTHQLMFIWVVSIFLAVVTSAAVSIHVQVNMCFHFHFL